MTGRGGAGLTDDPGRRRRGWRWAVALWALTAVVGGGTTLWLRDASEASQPPTWHRTEEPAPLLELDVDDYSGCPTPMGPPDGFTDVACVSTEALVP